MNYLVRIDAGNSLAGTMLSSSVVSALVKMRELSSKTRPGPRTAAPLPLLLFRALLRPHAQAYQWSQIVIVSKQIVQINNLIRSFAPYRDR